MFVNCHVPPKIMQIVINKIAMLGPSGFSQPFPKPIFPAFLVLVRHSPRVEIIFVPDFKTTKILYLNEQNHIQGDEDRIWDVCIFVSVIFLVWAPGSQKLLSSEIQYQE